MKADPVGACAPSFDELVALSPILHERLRHVGLGHEEAEDAIQDAFLRALSGRHSLSKPESWLFVVARRSAARARQSHCALSVDPEQFPFEMYENEEEERVRHADILRAIATLPEKLREVFVYCKVEDHTIAETAKRFNLHLGVATGRITRARKAIRRELKLPVVNLEKSVQAARSN